MHLLLLDAGGTISATPGSDGALDAGDGLADLASLSPLPVRAQRVYAGLSEEMGLHDATDIVAAALAAASDPSVVGVVVAHGTDTLEETAFLADLHWDSDTPLVFTGSQRAPAQPGYDGPANLEHALRIGATPGGGRRGVVIVFGGEVLPARGAAKRHTHALRGFAGSSARELPRKRPAALPSGPCDPSVELFAYGQGARPRMIDLGVADGVRGIVLEALGRGNAGPEIADAVRRATQAGVVVLAARRCAGGSVAPDYATGRRLQDAGAIFCDDLPPRQARVLLARMLGLHGDSAGAARAVADWLGVGRETQALGR